MPESVRYRSGAVPVLIIVLLYLAAAVLTDPRGEFPLNDDWAYTRSAFKFGSGAGMQVDEWSAPSLVGQAVYGGALVRLFGASFTVLRLSTIALSCGVALLLWFTLAALQVRRAVSWAAVLSWIFNPVQFCLAFTFMTEVPFLFFVGLACYLYALHVKSGSRAALLGCGLSLGYGFLIRQVAVLFMGPVLIVLLASPGRPWRRRLQCGAAFAAACGVFVAGYSLWLRGAGGSTPATQRKYELLRQLDVEQLAGNFFGIMFYLSFMLLPLAAALLPHIWRSFGEFGRRLRLGWPLAMCLTAAAGVAWFSRYSLSVYLPSRAFHSRMPYLLNVLYDTGLGPVTLDPTYYGPPETPTYPGVWRAVTLLVAAAVVPLGSALFLTFARAWRLRQAEPARAQVAACATMALLAVAAFEIVFSHTQEGGLFDRHILTAALPALILAALAAGRGRPAEPVRPGTRAECAAGSAAFLALALLAWFCVAATHDYLAWNRVRWDMGRELLATGVDPLNVSGGFEFNAWYNYDTFRARGNVGKVYYWWYDSEEFVIAMAPQEGYRTARVRSYYSWVHRQPVALFLLANDE